MPVYALQHGEQLLPRSGFPSEESPHFLRSTRSQCGDSFLGEGVGSLLKKEFSLCQDDISTSEAVQFRH